MPEWAARERWNDMAWIGENLAEFQQAAQQGFVELGRGAIVVDVTVQSHPGEGHPIWYVPQTLIDEYGSADDARMVARYEPRRECVVILLKHDRKVSSYRVALLGG